MENRPPFRVIFEYRPGDSTRVFLVNEETKESWFISVTNAVNRLPIVRELDFSAGEYVCDYAEKETFA